MRIVIIALAVLLVLILLYLLYRKIAERDWSTPKLYIKSLVLAVVIIAASALAIRIIAAIVIMIKNQN